MDYSGFFEEFESNFWTLWNSRSFLGMRLEGTFLGFMVMGIWIGDIGLWFCVSGIFGIIVLREYFAWFLFCLVLLLF